MPNPPTELLEYILRQCAAAAPQPWYPSSFQQPDVPTNMLDEALDRLRLAGLVQLTDWVQGRGQGYALTPEGVEVMSDTGVLSRLRQGDVPKAEKPAPRYRPSSSDSTWERGETVRSVLFDQPKPLVTMTLLGLNLFVFVGGLLLALQQGIPAGAYLGSGDIQVLRIRYEMGALSPLDVTARGQWWRLLAHAFVHHGILHIIMNMYFLFSVGPLVEAMWGRWRYLVLYLTSALGAGVAVVLFAEPQALHAGASGPLCGLLASMPVWVILNRRHLPPDMVSGWLRNIMTNIILIVIISMLPRISASGHFGGGAAGAILALPMVWQRFEHGSRKLLGLAGTIAIPLALVAVAYWLVLQGPPRDDRLMSIPSATRILVVTDLKQPSPHAERTT
jgi:membrane associated rhomboid family serine protease